MFGLFGILGEKVICGVLDTVIAGIDALDRATDVVIDSTDKMLDKIEDIRSTVEDTVIDAEFYAKEFKNSIDGIKVYSQSEYGRKTYLKDEVDYLKYNVQECKNMVKQNCRTISDDVKAVVNMYNTLKSKVTFVASFYNISDAEALQLMYDNCLIDDRDKAEFYR